MSILRWSSQLGLTEVPQVPAPVVLWYTWRKSLGLRAREFDSHWLDMRYFQRYMWSHLVLSLYCPCGDPFLSRIPFETGYEPVSPGPPSQRGGNLEALSAVTAR